MTMIYLNEKILEEGKTNYDCSEGRIPVRNSWKHVCIVIINVSRFYQFREVNFQWCSSALPFIHQSLHRNVG